MNVDRFVRTELRVDREQPFTTDLYALLKEWGLNDSAQERMWVVAYDSIEQLRTVQEIAVGGYHELIIPLPALLASVLLSGTDRFLIVHNHPSGDVTPTNLDVEMTHTIMGAANATGLFFEDSLIVGPRDARFSFTSAGLITPAPQTVAMANGTGHKRARTARAS
jgi:DNA repair protein RadC